MPSHCLISLIVLFLLSMFLAMHSHESISPQFASIRIEQQDEPTRETAAAAD